MSASIRLIAELSTDGVLDSILRTVQIEAKSNDEFKVALTINSVSGTTVGRFIIASDTLRDFRNAIDVVLGEDEDGYDD